MTFCDVLFIACASFLFEMERIRWLSCLVTLGNWSSYTCAASDEIKWFDFIQNAEVIVHCQLPSCIANVISTRRIVMFGHVACMDNGILARESWCHPLCIVRCTEMSCRSPGVSLYVNPADWWCLRRERNFVIGRSHAARSALRIYDVQAIWWMDGWMDGYCYRFCTVIMPELIALIVNIPSDNPLQLAVVSSPPRIALRQSLTFCRRALSASPSIYGDNNVIYV